MTTAPNPTESGVRVRFAPSPTGCLHVGGARTALFNWLYARNQGGAFILRVEDTDQERSTDASYEAILRGMEWLGLDWDEGPGKGGPHGPYLQSERLPIYQAALNALREAGAVYPCFCTSEEHEQCEEVVKAAGPAWDGYDGHCRDLDVVEAQRRVEAGEPCGWRLRVPRDGATYWDDLVVGKREFQNAFISDRVVAKADGFPTYNFAVVVDDHTMGITHVLRGDDHVSNTPFQLLIFRALGWKPPKFGHLPMILGPDRKRLSKRHGATSVEDFQSLGILPDAMVNHLALLGWSIGASGDEVLDRASLIKKFSLKKVNSSPAVFDYDKLEHINSQHLKRLGPDRRRELTLPILAARGWSYDPAWRVAGADGTVAYTDRILALLGGRFSSLLTLPSQIGFFFCEDHEVEAEALQEHLASPPARERVAALATAVAAAAAAGSPLTAGQFEDCVRDVAARLELGAGDLIHPARVALTGQNRSAGMFEVMELIGAPRVVARLQRAAGP
jgi:glutamyl-tRNA synthetase